MKPLILFKMSVAQKQEADLHWKDIEMKGLLSNLF